MRIVDGDYNPSVEEFESAMKNEEEEEEEREVTYYPLFLFNFSR